MNVKVYLKPRVPVSIILCIRFVIHYYTRSVLFETRYILKPTSLSQNAVWELAEKCLKGSGSPYPYLNDGGLVPTKDEQKSEMLRVLQITEFTRKIRSHSYIGYGGPWLEELWCRKLCCDLDNFGPFVPLFVCWTNMYASMRSKSPTLPRWKKRIAKLLGNLKKNFLYVTVLQMYYGIELCGDPDEAVPGNLLIMSQGGKGHIPLPLLLRECEPVLPSERINKVVFSGRIQSKRQELISAWTEILSTQLTISQKVKNWTDLYRAHDFVLCPRGDGRCSFRTYESIQLGLVTIIGFRARKWLPYLNSTLPWNELALHHVLSSTKETGDIVLGMSDETIARMRNRCVAYRHSHFTMAAVIEHIRLWMRGITRSDIRCDNYYIDC